MRSPSPAASPSPDPSAEARATALQAALTAAASKVVDRIQQEEAELYQKLSYFQKPERLDPNTYASIDEVLAWRKLLQDLAVKQDRVAALYANAGRNLDAELINAKVSAQIAQPFRNSVLDGFPWPTIQKKNQCFQRYIEAHAQLLNLYEKYWGSWDAGQPVKFRTTQLNASYLKAKNDLLSAGKQLDEQYKAMSE
ncbi:MAG TPA: hypothetical protein VGD78_23795 [Chthoniobacterales bacterium]